MISTDRLILRNFIPNDIDHFYEYCKSPVVGPMAGWAPHKSIGDSKSIIDGFVKDPDIYAVVFKENWKVIGSVGIHIDQKRPFDGVKSLGYALGEDYWGKGIMTEAVTRIIKLAFEEKGLKMLTCYHFLFNERSKRVIEKCGFTYEGTLRRGSKGHDGMLYDTCCYSLTRKEYFKKLDTSSGCEKSGAEPPRG